MALSPQQQQMYNQLVSAGASAQSALFAVQQIPSSAVSSPAPAVATSASATPSATPQATPAAPTATPSTTPSVTPTPQANPAQQTTSANPAQQTTSATNPAAATGPSGTSGPQAPTIPANGSIVDLLNSQGQNSSYAARAQMAQQFGIAGYTGSAAQNQQLAQKYTDYFNSVKKTDAPNTNPRADITAGTSTQPTTDPVMSSLVNMFAPILASISQVMSDINNPAITNTNLQNEYNQIAQQNNLPGMQTEMMNLHNIMDGTDQDIRDEVSKSGGFISESQIAALTASRNNVIVKQYNAIATQYQAAVTNVQNQMQYAQADVSTTLQKQQMTASISEGLASVESQMMNMGITMQQNANGNLNKIVSNVGYQGLAAQAQGNPQVLSYYENILGLSPGSLSDPSTLNKLETYRQQTIAQGQQKIVIQSYNAGLPIGGTTNNSSGSTSNTQVLEPGNKALPSTDSLGRPTTLTQAQVDSLKKQNASSITTGGDAGTNKNGDNLVWNGYGEYINQGNGTYALNQPTFNPKQQDQINTDQQYYQLKDQIQNSQDFSGSPKVTRTWSLTANAAFAPYKDTGTYKVISNIAPYLANIRAASQNPSSISDLELLDSYVRASKGGTGQVTDSQVNLALQGQSIGDKWDVMEQKLGTGGVLSPQQRTALINLASGVYSENSNDYKKIYVQALTDAQGQGIPPSFWNNMPDFTDLLTQPQ